MKNKIYFLGLIACMVTTCGCIFKINHWPAAGIMLATGLVILAALFLPLAIKSLYKGETNKRLKTFYLLVAIIMALNIISALFKIQHWPYAGLLLMISLLLTFAVLLPVFLLSNPDDKLINYRNFLAVMFFFAYFAAVSALLSLGVSKNVIDGFVRSAYTIEEKNAVLSENIKWLSSESETDTISGHDLFSKNRRIVEEADKLCGRIEEIKKMILINSSGNPSQVFKNNDHADLWAIKLKDNGPVFEMYYITELKNEINDYKVMLQKVCKPESALCNYFNEIFDTKDDNVEYQSWEQMMSKSKILVSAIEGLDLLQFRVRLASFEAVSATHE